MLTDSQVSGSGEWAFDLYQLSGYLLFIFLWFIYVYNSHMVFVIPGTLRCFKRKNISHCEGKVVQNCRFARHEGV